MAASQRLITVEELAKHNKQDDIWIVVDGFVYDITNFATEHPGGPEVEVIYAHAGHDASEAYSEVHRPSLISDSLPSSKHVGKLDLKSVPPDWKSKEQTQLQATGTNERFPLISIININDFEEAAQRSLSKKNWAFISGASNDNFTRDANKNLYQKITFRPRVLRNVAEVSTKTTMLGQKASLPLWISPAGLAKTAGPEGELALSHGAGATGIIQTISTTASFSLDEILGATKPGHPFFFQLYINKDRKKTEEMLREINDQSQVKAIFITVDLPVVSKREADERAKVETMQSSAMSGTQTFSDNKGAGLARSVGSFIDPSFSWDDLAWIRRHTKLPIVLKGIQSAADAQIAIRMGCQGIVVSNHGGRALDNAPAAIMVLLELHKHCPEVFDAMEVFIDGGVRRGSDILKAVCLGASGVGLGRPFMYALNYGKEGVEHAVNILKDELETAMRLCGLKDIRDADPSFVNTAELDVLVPPALHHPYARKHAGPQRTSRL